jgi:hypothetical protein
VRQGVDPTIQQGIRGEQLWRDGHSHDRLSSCGRRESAWVLSARWIRINPVYSLYNRERGEREKEKGEREEKGEGEKKEKEKKREKREGKEKKREKKNIYNIELAHFAAAFLSAYCCPIVFAPRRSKSAALRSGMISMVMSSRSIFSRSPVYVPGAQFFDASKFSRNCSIVGGGVEDLQGDACLRGERVIVAATLLRIETRGGTRH